jgi:hypothetical protein
VGGAPACYVVGKWSCESDSHTAGTVVLIYPRFFISWMLAHKFPLLFNVQGNLSTRKSNVSPLMKYLILTDSC